MINFAVIGTNFITDKFMDAVSKVENANVIGVYSRTLDRAKEYASKYDIKKTYTDLKVLCSDQQIDAVYIANPTSFHKDTAIALLKHKKHILCEKPLASNYKQVQKMIDVASENNVIILEALRSVHNPAIDIIRDNLQKIGIVRNVRFSFCQYSSRYDNFKNGIIENAFRRELSNGALMDLGCYLIHIAVNLFGEPKKVSAIGYELENSIDAVGCVMMSYGDKICELSYSKISTGLVKNEIQGENGTMIIDKIECPQNIDIIYRNGEKENIYSTIEYNDLVYEIINFTKAIDNKYDVSNAHKNSILTSKIIDNARNELNIKFPCDSR